MGSSGLVLPIVDSVAELPACTVGDPPAVIVAKSERRRH
eukprot:COSAG01_NODE_56628_length_317_cov_0.706422_1_plen_38_part_01